MRSNPSKVLITAACLMPLPLQASVSSGTRPVMPIVTHPVHNPTPGWAPTNQFKLSAETVNLAGGPAFARVAFTNFSPWCFKDQNGRYQGILVDFLRDLSQDVGLTLREEDVPIARLHHNLSHGKLDLFVSKLPEGGFNCCASLGKAFDSEVVILGKNSGPGWDANRTAGISICRTGLSGYNIPGFRMFDADSLDTCVRMVTHDRLPFVIGERHSLAMTMQRQKPEVSRLFSAPQVVEKKEFHLFISNSLDQTPFGPMIRKALLQRKISDYISRYSDSKP